MQADHRWQNLLLSLVLLVCCFAPVHSQNTITMDKSCYAINEDIIVTFNSENPEDDDWVGIYSINSLTGDDEPSLWVSTTKDKTT
jgi:hypothetical protein